MILNLVELIISVKTTFNDAHKQDAENNHTENKENNAGHFDTYELFIITIKKHFVFNFYIIYKRKQRPMNP